jgi:hypothetical protein
MERAIVPIHLEIEMFKAIGILAIAGFLLANGALGQTAQQSSHDASCRALASATLGNLHAGCDNLAIKMMEGTSIDGCTAMAINLRNRNFIRDTRRLNPASVEVHMPWDQNIVLQLRTLCTEFVTDKPI